MGTWGGIFRSADSGQTWDHALFAYNSEVFKAIVANSEGVLFAGSTNFKGNYSPGGVYKSGDNGETWELIGLDYYFISAMVVDSEDKIYACARGNYYTGELAVFKSTDNGVSWEIVYENNTVNTITRNEYNEVAIGCDTQDGTQGGMFCSYDEGENWAEITNNLPSNNIYKVIFKSDNHLYTITHSGTKLYKTETPVNVSQHQFAKQYPFTVYPNPAKSQIRIRLKDALNYDLWISDIYGNMVQSAKICPEENFISLKIQELKPGMYFVNYSDNNRHRSSLKFIKY